MTETLKAPFPWFGGKSRVVDLVWSRFGNVANYVEPFFGSGAMLLGRPDEPGTETVNDLDGMVSNFWRAVAVDPDGVAAGADWPINELDLHARHQAICDALLDREGLTERQIERVEKNGLTPFAARLEMDTEFHDAKLAGWWAWGACSWIGSAFRGRGPRRALFRPSKRV